jgi:hypothetical protein
MVREAKRTNGDKIGAVKPNNDSFRFLTIYDPRSSTDYQCGVVRTLFYAPPSFLPSFLFMMVSLSLSLLIYYCLSAFSDTT